MAYHFRLRIRNAADSGDECIFSSLPTDTYPHITTPPFGDGQLFDHLSGRTSIGEFIIEVADVVVAGSTRTVTQFLADATLRQQLVSRRAYIEYTTNAGGAWNALIAGFVSRIVLTTAQRYTFSIGEARRVEERLRVFQRPTDAFPGFTNLLGWPFVSQWGRGEGTDGIVFPPRGAWALECVDASSEVALFNFKSGFVALAAEASSYAYQQRPTAYQRQRVAELFAQDFVTEPTAPLGFANGTVIGRYPNIVAFVSFEGNTYGPFTLRAWSSPNPQDGPTPLGDYNPFSPVTDSLLLEWAGADGIVSAGDRVQIWAYRNYVSPSSPLHITDHPVDVVTKLFDEAGLAYNAASAAATRELLGPDSYCVLRITEPPTLEEITAQLGAYWGFGLRYAASGEREFFASRIQSASAPVATVTAAELFSADPPIFEVDDATLKNAVLFKELAFSAWRPGRQREADEVVAYPATYPFDNGEIPEYGANEVVFAIPGYGVGVARAAIAAEIFDRFGRGGIYSRLHVAPSVTAKVGEELTLNVPHLPNVNVRGGSRIVQVVQRTPRVEGPELRVLDAGSTAQAAPEPEFTLAVGAADSRKVADVTIDNEAALNAAGVSVRVEWGFGDVEPDGGVLLHSFRPGEIPAAFSTPFVDAGTHIWMRMRSEVSAQRPSDWTDWQDADLDDLAPPSAVSFLQEQADDDGIVTVAFTPGETDMPTRIYVRDQADGAEANQLVTSVPAGADRAYLSLIVGNDYTITLVTEEDPPFAGRSTEVEEDYTVPGVAPTLDPPTQAMAYSYPSPGGQLNRQLGRRGPVAENEQGSAIDKSSAFSIVGLSVIASTQFGSVEFQVAVETAPGSGVYGTFETYAIMPSQGTTARTAANLSVPLGDRLRRQFRARMWRDDGATVSAYCPTQTVDPQTSVPEFAAPTAGGVTGVLSATGTGPWEYLTDGVTRSNFSLPLTNVVATEHAFSSPFSSGIYALDQSYAQQAVATTGSLIAMYAYADSANPSGTVGQILGAFATAEHSGDGTVTNARGLTGVAFLSGDGIMTNGIGVLATVVKTGGGTITTAYGLKVDDITVGTTNYAIYTGAGLVRFGDEVFADGGLTVTGLLSYTDLSIANHLLVSTATDNAAYVQIQNDSKIATRSAPVGDIYGLAFAQVTSTGDGGVTAGHYGAEFYIEHTAATSKDVIAVQAVALSNSASAQDDIQGVLAIVDRQGAGDVDELWGMQAFVASSNASGTTDEMVGFRASINTFSSAVVNNIFGFYAAITASATNKYAYYAPAQTGSGTAWSFYSAGTEPSLLSGPLTITYGAGGTGALLIPSTSRLYLDGGGDTFLEEASANVFGVVVGGATRLGISTSNATFGTELVVGTDPTGDGLVRLDDDVNGMSLRTVGTVGVIGAPSSSIGANISGTIPGSGTSKVGVQSNATASSSTTGGYAAFAAHVNSAAAAFTLPNAYGLYVGPGSKGAGSTITTQYGVYVDTQALGGTNYAIYTNGTAQARLGGALAVVGDLVVGSDPGGGDKVRVGGNLRTATSGENDTILYSDTDNSVLFITAAASSGSNKVARATFTTNQAGLLGIVQAATDRLEIGTSSNHTFSIFTNGSTRWTIAAGGDITQTGGLGVGGSLYVGTDPGGDGLVRLDDDANGMSLRTVGTVGVVGAASSSIGVNMTGTIPGSGTSKVGVQSNATANSSTTAGYAAFAAHINTAASSFTLSNAYGVYVGPGSKGATSTITNHYGVYVDTVQHGGTLNIALYLKDPSGTGADTILAQSGAKLTTAGVWTDAPSWRSLKYDITALDSQRISEVLREIKPMSFRYHATKRRALGILLDDYLPTMHRAGLLDIDESPGVAATHLATLALAGWKAHDERLAALEARVTVLEG